MKHALGYKEYARQDGLPRHQAFFAGERTADGEPLCGLCTYPIVGVKEDKQEREQVEKEVSKWR